MNPILLFDGVCNFCDASVNFIIRHDPSGIFRFAPLQSAPGQELLKKFSLSTIDLDTMVLVDGEKVYTRSTAALKIARRLSGLWPLFSIFMIVPRPIRDWVYGIVAKNRYRWWGKKDACLVPTPAMKTRFL